jgi:hypothetical protein
MRHPLSKLCRSATARRALPFLLTAAGLLGGPGLPVASANSLVPATSQNATPAEARGPTRVDVESLMRSAAAGEAAAAERLAVLYERESGLLVWDPPSALRWYAAAALAGSPDAGRAAVRLWKHLAPTHAPRAEALLARNFTDEALERIGIGPVRREILSRQRWAAMAEPAGFADPRPVPAAPVAAVAAVPAAAAAEAPAAAAAAAAGAAKPAGTAMAGAAPLPKQKPAAKAATVARAKPVPPRTQVASLRDMPAAPSLAADKDRFPALRPAQKPRRPS